MLAKIHDLRTTETQLDKFRAQAQQCNVALDRLNRRHEQFCEAAEKAERIAETAKALVEAQEAAEIALEATASELSDFCATRDRVVVEVTTGIVDALQLQAGCLKSALDDCSSSHRRAKETIAPPKLDQILGNECVYAALLACAERCGCAESVRFLRDVADFRKLPQGPASAQRFVHIVSKYVAPGSPQEINIDAEGREALVTLAKTPQSITEQAFANAEKQIA